MLGFIHSVKDGDMIGLVLCSCDTQIGFGLEKRNKKVSNSDSETSLIYHMWLKYNFAAPRHCKIFVFIYIDFHVEILRKE